MNISADKENKYVLMTSQNNYFVEFLLNELVLSTSTSEAMIFDDEETAVKFQKMLKVTCQLETTVSTFLT